MRPLRAAIALVLFGAILALAGASWADVPIEARGAALTAGFVLVVFLVGLEVRRRP